MVSSGILFGLGDFIAQIKFQNYPKYDYKRTRNFFILGSIFAAPALHKWYQTLAYICEQYIFRLYSLNRFQKVFIYTAIDQTIGALSLNLCFFITLNLMEHHSVTKACEIVNERYVETMIESWKVWPIAQFYNFYYVPI